MVDDVYNLFLRLFDPEALNKRTIKEDLYCCGAEKINIDSRIVCQICGKSSFYALEYHQYPGSRVKYRSIYKHAKHFELKLNEIQGLLLPPNDIWKPLFKNIKIETVADVRKIIKENNLTKYNRYAYYIYNQITKKTVFKFTESELYKIKLDFAHILKNFSLNKSLVNRKNLFNYHFIIFKILKNRNYKTDQLFKPKLKQSIEKNEKAWRLLFHSSMSSASSSAS
jgi:hypothetical protein